VIIIMDKNNAVNKPSACNCLNLRRASQAITAVYDKILTRSGLNISQYSLLKCTRLLSPASVTELAANIRLDRTTLVRNLKPLEGKGLITDVSPKGTRNRRLMLTETGIEALSNAALLWQETQDFIEQYLGKSDLLTLTSLLSKVEALDL